VDAHGRPEGWPVLDDVDGALGLTLWRALRAVWTWVDTLPERRGGLSQEPTREVRERFAYAVVEAPELTSALGTFVLLTSHADMVDPGQLAQACRAVYEWAENRSLVETAIHFAEAAARVSDKPEAANIAGRMCRRGALDERSAAWFARAFRLAVREREKGETLRALLGYGALLRDLGRYDEARAMFERAARRAARTGRLRQAAEAHHDLLAIAAELGSYSDAERHARLAGKLYPVHHARFPYLVHDFAFVLVRQQSYTAALALLEDLLRVEWRPSEWLLVWSTTTWAAAGSARVHFHDRAEHEVLQLIGMHEEYASAAYIHLAEGARHLGRWERAERYVTAAGDAARRRKDAALEQEARALQGVIAAREPAPREKEPQSADRTQMLARWLANRLRRWRAPKPPDPPSS
jgi:tetratricopeptide (TPR) repeat protein